MKILPHSVFQLAARPINNSPKANTGRTAKKVELIALSTIRTGCALSICLFIQLMLTLLSPTEHLAQAADTSSFHAEEFAVAPALPSSFVPQEKQVVTLNCSSIESVEQKLTAGRESAKRGDFLNANLHFDKGLAQLGDTYYLVDMEDDSTVKLALAGSFQERDILDSAASIKETTLSDRITIFRSKFQCK